MEMKLIFTNKGKNAIGNFENDELIEVFTRYSKTLMKKYDLVVSVPSEDNRDITADGTINVQLNDVKCDVQTFFKELARDVKVPLKKRLDAGETLDGVFKAEQVK
ncbi:hypothetical protein ACTHSJ_03105 [Paenibacillus cellulositrophicus]|uniref:hypothetical protein n=1 Tax=Paenibacillus cellulositrophicus TaxID=562959 RepID=UPI003F7DF2C2|nr:hypothetical protein BGX30_004155 [Mortierella sp. GBA39]